jgi:hypothetical protein
MKGLSKEKGRKQIYLLYIASVLNVLVTTVLVYYSIELKKEIDSIGF